MSAARVTTKMTAAARVPAAEMFPAAEALRRMSAAKRMETARVRWLAGGLPKPPAPRRTRFEVDALKGTLRRAIRPMRTEIGCTRSAVVASLNPIVGAAAGAFS